MNNPDSPASRRARTSLALKQVADSRFDPATSALVVVDVQNDFCRPEGVLGQSGNDTAAALAMLPSLTALINEARELGVLIVFIRSEHDSSNEGRAWQSRKDGSARPATGRALTCRPGSWGAQLTGLNPASSDVIVTKHRYSAFVGTSLDLVLRAAGIRSLFFTGVATEVCVDSSLREGLFHDYWVTLVEDCCASYHPARHAATVEIIRESFGVVTTSTTLVDHWRTPCGTRTRVDVGDTG